MNDETKNTTSAAAAAAALRLGLIN